MRLVKLNRVINSIADAGLVLWRQKSTEEAEAEERTPVELCNELLSTQGEASGTAIARKIATAYAAMRVEEQSEFFHNLRHEFHLDPEEVVQAAENYKASRDDKDLRALVSAAEPRRQELIRRLNMAPNGTAFLVGMRRDLLGHLEENSELEAVDDDFVHILSSWFNRGFLTLERIDWNTPASVLEKLIEYETVHAMRGWDDLRRRLSDDRRCFAFFHSALPGEPLIFVEVALVQGLSAQIDPIIADDREHLNPDEADTAIFYSINACHKGLSGISFGDFLIKQVVVELKQELPQLEAFSTLSPVPRFIRWTEAMARGSDEQVLKEAAVEALELLSDPHWPDDENVRQRLEPLIMQLAAHYFFNAKRGVYPYDPVARFHLRNGARLERINWLGDLSDKGVDQSAGLMVNYLYDPKDIETNHERYIKNHHIAAAANVTALAEQGA